MRHIARAPNGSFRSCDDEGGLVISTGGGYIFGAVAAAIRARNSMRTNVGLVWTAKLAIIVESCRELAPRPPRGGWRPTDHSSWPEKTIDKQWNSLSELNLTSVFTMVRSIRARSQLVIRCPIGATTILKFTYQDGVDRSFQNELYVSALRDSLTSALKKEHFSQRLNEELAYALRHATPVALIFLDLDRFKAINDSHGHMAGDHVLVATARLMRSLLRQEDLFGRYGVAGR